MWVAWCLPDRQVLPSPLPSIHRFSCTEQSSKPGYRCTRFQVTNYMSDALSLVSSKLEHGEWEQKPPSAIQPASTGAWEANGCVGRVSMSRACGSTARTPMCDKGLD